MSCTICNFRVAGESSCKYTDTTATAVYQYGSATVARPFTRCHLCICICTYIHTLHIYIYTHIRNVIETILFDRKFKLVLIR